MSLLKKIAVLAMSTLPVTSHSVPVTFSKDSHNRPPVIDQLELQPSKPLSKTTTEDKLSPKRVIVFGDSLSEIGNTQLLLEVLAGKQKPSVIFKPLNENAVFRKLLSYFNISFPKIEHFENKIAEFFIHVLDFFVKVPVFPDHYYYSGPDGDGHGRFSNGPNWSEWLGYMVLGTNIESRDMYVNRAYGGSWASRLGEQKIDWTLDWDKFKASVVEFINGKLMPPNMHSLVSAFIEMEQPKSAGGEMIAVFYGANDYMNNDYLSDSKTFPPRIKPENVVKDITDELVRLADWASKAPEGAPESYIYIAGLPRMSVAPRYISGGKKGQGEYADNDVKEHNRLLEESYQKLSENPAYKGKVNFRFIDTFAIFERLYANSTATNMVDACYPNDMLSSAMLMKNISQQSNTVKPCPADKQDSYFFWDQAHPTRVVYASLAGELCQIVGKDISASCFTPNPDAVSTYPRPAFNP